MTADVFNDIQDEARRRGCGFSIEGQYVVYSDDDKPIKISTYIKEPPKNVLPFEPPTGSKLHRPKDRIDKKKNKRDMKRDSRRANR